MTSDHTPDGGAMDTRRLVVMDEVQRNMSLFEIRESYDAAPSIADLRERIAEMAHEFGDLTANTAIGNGKYWPDTATFADAVLAVLLGTDPEEARRGE